MNEDKRLQEIWEKTQQKIEDYHIHIYGIERAYAAMVLRDDLRGLFAPYILSESHVQAVGPHQGANYAFVFNKNGIGELLSWLQMNNPHDVSVLVHPETGDDYTDHTAHALWFGQKKGLNLNIFPRP